MRRWWLNLFFFCVDMAAINGFVLSRLSQSLISFENQLSFRVRLVELLLRAGGASVSVPPVLSHADGRPAGRQSRRHALPDGRLVGASHLPIWAAKHSRCQLCYHNNPGKPHFTRQKCSACGVFLCNKPDRMCFFDYHQENKNVGV